MPVPYYTLGVDGTTKYLSEVETGTEVLVLDSKGKARRAIVSKIESTSHAHDKWQR